MKNTVEWLLQLKVIGGGSLSKIGLDAESAKKKTTGLDAAFGKAGNNGVKTLDRSLNQLRDNLRRYEHLQGESFRVDHIRKYNTLIDTTKRKIRELERETSIAGETSEGFFERISDKTGIGSGLLKGGLAVAAAAKVAQVGFSIGKESFGAANEIEKYEAALKNMLGTTEAAKDRMQEYFKIAAQTPFDLPQVIEAGNKLQALGRYSEDNVKMLGDLAAASGKPMEQAMSAFSKMASGQKGIAVDMFRDLMITVDDWTKATGKGVSKSGELLASTDELLAALPKIMKSKGYFGMMATQAETTAGKLSNLEDNAYQLKVAFGERLQPTLRNLMDEGNRAIDIVKRWVEIPSEQKIAREKAEMNALVDSLIGANDNEALRTTYIDLINQKYPELLKNLDLEKASVEEIKTALEGANEEYDKKIRKAYLQRMLDELQEDADDALNNVVKYQASMAARTRYNEIQNGREREILEAMGYKGSDAYIDHKGNIKERIADNGYYAEVKVEIPEEYVQEVAEISANKAALGELMTSYGEITDKKREAKYKNKYDAVMLKRSMYEGFMDDFLGTKKDDNKGNGGGTGGSNGDGNKNGGGNTGGGGTTTTAVEAAADSISGGGKQVKNYYITINDGLIKEVVNHFNSTNENPETASDFMDKLSRALQNVVNDVNYMS